MMVENYFFDCFVCKCGFHTPIRPSRIPRPGEDRRLTETASETLQIACSGCSRVYSVATSELVPEQSGTGLSPFHEGAPQHLFPVSIKCDASGCEFPLVIFAVMNTATTTEAVKQEIAHYRGADLRCQYGHVQDFPSGWE